MGGGAFAQNGQHVIIDQAFGRTPTEVHAAAGKLYLLQRTTYSSHRLDLLLHRLLRALSNGQHGNDSAHANNNSQHGEH